MSFSYIKESFLIFLKLRMSVFQKHSIKNVFCNRFAFWKSKFCDRIQFWKLAFMHLWRVEVSSREKITQINVFFMNHYFWLSLKEPPFSFESTKMFKQYLLFQRLTSNGQTSNALFKFEFISKLQPNLTSPTLALSGLFFKLQLYNLNFNLFNRSLLVWS